MNVEKRSWIPSKKGKKRGPGNQILVRHGKKMLNTQELAELSEYPELTRKNVYDRLRRLGFPPEINSENYNDILGPLCDPVVIIKYFSIVGDDKKYSGSELSKRFGIPRYTMSRLKARGQFIFTVEELESISNSLAELKKPVSCDSDPTHLSDSKNTGIAKREATEKVTDLSVKKLASAVIRSAFNQYLRPALKGKACKDKAAVLTAEREKKLAEKFLFTENEMRKFWFENLGLREDSFSKEHIDANGPEILRRLANEAYEGMQHNS